MAFLTLNRHGFFSIRFRLKFLGKWLQCCEGTEIFGVRVGNEIYPADKRKYAAAVKWAKDIAQEIEDGTFQYLCHFPNGNKAHLFKPVGPVLFAKHAEEWLADRTPPVLRTATWRGYKGIIESTLIPLVGDEPLAHIGDHQQDIRRKLQAILIKRSISATRMAYIFKLFRTILADGKVVFEIPGFTGTNRRRKLEYFPEDERNILLETFDPHWEPFFTVAFFTGMRPSEQIALKPDDLDFHHKQIAIYRSLVEGVEGPTKTEASQRTIDMLPEVEAALLRFGAIRKKLKTVKTKYFFCTQRGDELRADSILNNIWYPTLKETDLRRRVMYSTRHTFASVFLSRGYDSGWVAHMMGDNLATILKHYYNFVPKHTPMNRSPKDTKIHQ